ncbi:carboxylesterase/lipase family protein [Phenylobacterium sp.]|uniref:carboxylesterase/lipase family protein n=1 Tax=Phenylobacterium sp. TaxID=1871053 RepID=UPI002FC7442E
MRVLGLALALSLALAACAQAEPRPPLAGERARALVDGGPIEGRSAGGVAAFRGVPYAAAPVGDLRWRPPQPVAAWTAPRDASRFGSDCLQHPLPTFVDPGSGQPRSEDCLYLNVWAPEQAKGRPVMVWIHGGGFTIGSGAMAVSDGAALARQGVVVVTLNYRLGRFGFFAHPALARPGEPTGNYAIMDQIAALQWVKRNIAAFGGDPTNVTVFGESAGGGSVLALMGSPAARGLFHKAIVESGGGRDVLASLEASGADAPAGYAAGEAFAEKAGLKAPDAAALRALPAEKVLGDLAFFNNRNRDDYTGPMIDGRVVTGNPSAIFARGEQAPVPLIIGFNSAELAGAKAVTGGWAKQAAAKFGPAEAGLRKIYDPNGGDDGLAANFLSDLIFVEPARFLARAHARAGHPVFLYQFDYVAEAKRATTPGAGHATEIAYVFDTVGQVDSKVSAQDRAMSAVVSRYWTAFAAYGDPNGAGRPSWPAYRPKADTLLNFMASGGAPLAGRSAARLDYIEASWPKP